MLLVKGVDATWEAFLAFGASGWTANWVLLLSQKESIFYSGEHIWETSWTSGDSSSDTLDVFSRAEEFVAAAFEVASVGIDILWVLVFLRLVSGSVVFCGAFLK